MGKAVRLVNGRPRSKLWLNVYDALTNQTNIFIMEVASCYLAAQSTKDEPLSKAQQEQILGAWLMREIKYRVKTMRYNLTRGKNDK